MKKLFLFAFIFFFINCKKDLKSKKESLLDFNQFFEKFATDSIYQKEHIKFPLKCLFYDNANYEKLETELIASKSDFRYIDFSKDSKAMNQETDKFTIEKEKIKQGLIYKRVGYDNGIYQLYEFKVIENCWYLIKITDEST
ncbi:DUF4348 domain-containing protein [Flavobacterium sp. LC2016-12]|uniref:DUF4348 domain-containing protein n=1 Tax=Flavobacterium sp. LC2016-12 TaxID=2783794 RepID=UPI00188B33F8|nr:DUF4348 domain-containing protein [Flavobacterium sp. LC2016-12]MBF4463665.1 DUF4348 domain-containing protein [Flavobacterium sp. LC2016-12]